MSNQSDTSSREFSYFGIKTVVEPRDLVTTDVDSLTLGLIDSHLFSQECLIKAFNSLHPNLTVLAFATVQEYRAAARSDLDVVLCHLYGTETSEAAIGQAVTTICQTYRRVPLIVLSDEDDSQQLKTVRAALKNGARGFIPTRSTGLSMTFTAIRLVKAGGTYVPIDLLLANQSERPETPQDHLTPRQSMVLSNLRQGKANKIITYELGLSESTVKIHVRNLMRKLGATNRTQVVYKAEKFLSGEESECRIVAPIHNPRHRRHRRHGARPSADVVVQCAPRRARVYADPHLRCRYRPLRSDHLASGQNARGQGGACPSASARSPPSSKHRWPRCRTLGSVTSAVVWRRKTDTP